MTGTLLLVASATLTIYLFLIVLLRVFGRHELTQLTVADVVVMLTLGSAVETSMIRGDTSLAAGLTAAVTLLLANAGLTTLAARWSWLTRLLNGRALIVVHDGRILEGNLHRAGLTRDELFEALRAREHATLVGVRYAVVEVDGSISVVDA